MLVLILVSIHNLHYYLNLVSEVHVALEAGFFRKFHIDRVRGV